MGKIKFPWESIFHMGKIKFRKKFYWQFFKSILLFKIDLKHINAIMKKKCLPPKFIGQNAVICAYLEFGNFVVRANFFSTSKYFLIGNFFF